MQKQHAVTSEPDCEEPLGEMILVFPVVLSTCGARIWETIMQLPGGVERRLNVHSGEAQLDGRAGRALLLCSHQTSQVLCVLVSGDGERCSNHLSFCKRAQDLYKQQ